MCLDILRAAPTALPALMKEIYEAKGCDPVLDGYIHDLFSFVDKLLKSSNYSGIPSPDIQRSARELAGRLALGMQASVITRYGDPKVWH